MKYYFLILFVAISACNGAMITKDNNSVTLNLSDMLNKGVIKYHVKMNQKMIINDTKESKKWQVSLGRRDFKAAIIDKYENNSQKSLRFTKIGTYQVKLGSHRSSVQGTIMMHALTIIVE